jgi:hypothetical protein
MNRDASQLPATGGLDLVRNHDDGARRVSLGDDSGNADYSLGDDGLIVTNAAGRILQ